MIADLFKKDLPAGVDASAIALRNFTGGGIDIAAFTKELDQAVKEGDMADENATLEIILKAVAAAAAVGADVAVAAIPNLDDTKRLQIELAIGQISGLLVAASKVLAGEPPQPLDSYDEGLRAYLKGARVS